jgi:hypothetical protein
MVLPEIRKNLDLLSGSRTAASENFVPYELEVYSFRRVARTLIFRTALTAPSRPSAGLEFFRDHRILLKDIIPIQRVTLREAALGSAVHLLEVIGFKIPEGIDFGPGRFPTA